MKKLLVLLLLLVSAELAIPPEVIKEPYKRPPSDSECMAVAIHDEARGEPVKGMRAVLDTILARMKKRNKTACEVVLEHKQFSGMKPYMLFDIPEEIITNYEKVARLPPVVRGCDYFHATHASPKWAKEMTICKQVGKHIFYKEKKK